MDALRIDARALRRVFRHALLASAPLAACASTVGSRNVSDGNEHDGGAADAGDRDGRDGGSADDGSDAGGAIGDAGDSGDVLAPVDVFVCMSCFCGLPIPAPPPWPIPYICANVDGSTGVAINDGGTDAALGVCLGDSGLSSFACSPGVCPCMNLGCPPYYPPTGGLGGSDLEGCKLAPGNGAELECLYTPQNCGRRPSGYRVRRPWTACDPVGAYLASSALLEAISVDAFEILSAELRAHDAPDRLVRAAQRAAGDEVRHARRTMALATRFGAKPAVPGVSRPPVRSIEAIALDNMVEGCVRETYGALVATHQGRRAADPVVRATMARIAQDETRHAALAWDIAHWAWTRLDDGARRRVECARARAICELRGDLAREPHAEVARVLGIPCSAVAMAMGEALEATVWRATA